MITYNASGYTYDYSGLTYNGEEVTTSERRTSMNWAPRWVNAYYTESSLLRQVFFLGLIYPQTQLTTTVEDEVYPKFWGKTGQARFTYVAEYGWAKEYIPTISYFSPSGEVSVDYKDTLGSLLYEALAPCFTISDGQLKCRNLSLVSGSVVAASGQLDLTSILAGDPAQEDSPFFVVNSYGDIKRVDQTSWEFDNGTIKIGLSGFYTVYYISEAVHTSLLNKEYYLLIEGEKVFLDLSHNENVWDRYAELHDFSRKYQETNLSLGEKCRILSLANKTEQRIGAMLGQSQFFHWGTADASAYSFTGSGAYSLELIDSKEFEYVTENPYKDGDDFRLTYIPHDYVQVFYRGRKVETDAYTVSGGILISNSNVLKNATQESVSVDYRTSSFTRTPSGDFVETITVANSGTTSTLGIYSTNIQVNNSSKRVDNWRWNVDPGLLTGTADFDF